MAFRRLMFLAFIFGILLSGAPAGRSWEMQARSKVW
jgi:hypothetical protein